MCAAGVTFKAVAGIGGLIMVTCAYSIACVGLASPDIITGRQVGTQVRVHVHVLAIVPGMHDAAVTLWMGCTA